MNELINYIPYLFGILIIISIISFGVSIAQKSIAGILIGIVAVIISGTFFGGSVIVQKYTPLVMEYINIAKDYIAKHIENSCNAVISSASKVSRSKKSPKQKIDSAS